MEHTDMKQVLQNLLQDETIEQTMIALYDALLRVDVGNCIEEDKRADFVAGVQVLKRDSEFHREAISQMIKKYQ
ncbi:MAG: hypothetical protein H8D63_01150 [Parcubacteria group bacterium]|nr:hypothetical protein [Parcubacteria group bacterium]